jgi:hypothetical protein
MLAVGATLFVITAIMVRTSLQPPAHRPIANDTRSSSPLG